MDTLRHSPSSIFSSSFLVSLFFLYFSFCVSSYGCCAAVFSFPLTSPLLCSDFSRFTSPWKWRTSRTPNTYYSLPPSLPFFSFSYPPSFISFFLFPSFPFLPISFSSIFTFGIFSSRRCCVCLVIAAVYVGNAVPASFACFYSSCFLFIYLLNLLFTLIFSSVSCNLLLSPPFTLISMSPLLPVSISLTPHFPYALSPPHFSLPMSPQFNVALSPLPVSLSHSPQPDLFPLSPLSASPSFISCSQFFVSP